MVSILYFFILPYVLLFIATHLNIPVVSPATDANKKKITPKRMSGHTDLLPGESMMLP
jgi:hypothetical protein